MELKTSSKGSKPSHPEEVDMEMLEHLVDEYGDSIDPENSPKKHCNETSPLKLSPSPVKKQACMFEPRDYNVSDMRTYVMDKSLQQNDLVGFELQ